jgi:signal transduction histidine kinase
LIDRHLHHYNRLQWKLTLSYAVVTVLVTLTIETGLLAAVMLGIVSDLSRSQPARLESLTPGLIPYLSTRTPDREHLQVWLEVTRDLEKTGETGSPVGPPNSSIRGILDAEGRSLASLASAPVSDIGTPPALNTADMQMISAALQGRSDGTRDRVSPRFWSLTAAAPIRDAKGLILGVLYFKATYDDNRVQILNVRGLLLPGLLFAALVAGLAAVLSGYLNARSLTRRLKRLAERADQWSQGDFTVTVEDASTDELGELARHFNTMAGEINGLLKARQSLAALEERNRLARDLHDSVKQQVFAIAMLVSAAQTGIAYKPEAAQASLADAADLTHQVQQELELLIHELRPAALQQKGLAHVLKEYVTIWSRQRNVAVNIQVDEACTTPPEMQQALFRVTQEALANIARHSHAKTVRVSLGWSEDCITLQVWDDGVGFDPTAVLGQGMGLHSMRERVEALGGSLVIQSTPGQGARVLVTCRLMEPQEATE